MLHLNLSRLVEQRHTGKLFCEKISVEGKEEILHLSKRKCGRRVTRPIPFAIIKVTNAVKQQRIYFKSPQARHSAPTENACGLLF